MKQPGEAWDYRTTTRVLGTKRVFAIRHVFFDDKGRPDAWGLDPAGPTGETPAELMQDYEAMKGAFDQPVIDLDEKEPA